MNDKCQEIQEYVEKEIHLAFNSEESYIFNCFSYDTKKILKQKLLSKLSPFLKISISMNSSIFTKIPFIRLELIESDINKLNFIRLPLLEQFMTSSI